MTQPVRRILVAVKNVRSRTSPTLKKAAQLARALNARIELFHAISDPIVIETLAPGSRGITGFEASQRTRCLKRLDAMATSMRRDGLTVSVAAEWDYPAHEAVIRRARRTGADLIVAERHESRHVAPWVLRYADWELLRHSPVPVLLIKTRRAYGSVKVLAAVDPSHALAKTAALDTRILRIASQVSTAARGQLHAVHAFVPSLGDVPEAELTLPDSSARIMRNAQGAAAKRLASTLRAARLGKLAPGRRHLVAQHAADAIPLVARTHGIGIVVMGLVRTGFKGLLIGNTAERLLDDLACDLLIVKPPGFQTRVPAKSRGPELISVGLGFGTI